jgi:ketosteroid isomerase-like protein
MRSPEGWPEPGPFEGRDAVMRQYEQMRDTWDADAAEPVEFIDAGDRVVGRFVWRGMGQGPDADIAASSVVTMRDGKIVGVEYFWDHTEALEAARGI